MLFLFASTCKVNKHTNGYYTKFVCLKFGPVRFPSYPGEQMVLELLQQARPTSLAQSFGTGLRHIPHLIYGIAKSLIYLIFI